MMVDKKREKSIKVVGRARREKKCRREEEK